jgi:hypothetical protein
MDLLRKRLLGKEGPYADVREATDQLDNVKLWVSELNESQRSDLFHHLLSLMLDDDIEVATAAVLSLDFVSKHFDCEAASVVLSRNDSRLYRAPYRFSRISFGTILEEYFARLSRFSPELKSGLIEQVLRRNEDSGLRTSLLCMLAQNYPSTVVYFAREMLNHQNAQVIAAIPNHAERVAVATSLRPWPADAIERVTTLLRIRKVDSQDIDAIVRTMSDTDQRLTCPAGLKDDRQWWIVAVKPWKWTMWETQDGSLAFQWISPGMSYAESSRILSASEANEFRISRSVPVLSSGMQSSDV